MRKHSPAKQLRKTYMFTIGPTFNMHNKTNQKSVHFFVEVIQAQRPTDHQGPNARAPGL